MQIVVRICVFVMEISSECSIVYFNHRVQERYCVLGDLVSELYGVMYRV